jgi:hypothetical protein
MIRTRHFVTAALFAVVLPMAASAQAPAKLFAGKWTGTVAPPDAPMEIPMTFEVKTPGDSIQIAAALSMEGQTMTFVFNNAKVADNTLTFTFDAMGNQVSCALKGQPDGSFVGECKDAGGAPGIMKMIPPKKEGGL